MCICLIFVIISDFSIVNSKDIKYATTSFILIFQDKDGRNPFEEHFTCNYT